MAAAPQFRFVSVPAKENLNNATVNDFAKDSYGFVWIATDNGVAVFDGVMSDKVPVENEQQIKAKCLLPVSDELMLVGAPTGLYAKQVGKHTPMGKLLEEDIHTVRAMGMLDSDKVGVATTSSLFVLDTQGAKKKEIDLKGLEVFDIEKTKGRSFIATDKGLYTFGDSAIIAVEAEGLPRVDMRALMYDNGVLYIGTREKSGNNIYVYNTETKRVASVPIGGVIVSSFVKTPDGTLLVGTNGDGLMMLDMKQNMLIADSNHVHYDNASTHNNQIYALHLDGSGQLFVGYYMLGASYSLPNSNLFTIFKLGDFDTKGLSVRTIASNDSHMLIGTRSGAYVVDRRRGTVKHLQKEDLNSNLVMSSAIKGDDIYIGTYGGGLSVYNTATGALSRPTFSGRAPSSVFAITTDAQGNVGLGTDVGMFVLKCDSVVNAVTSLSEGGATGNVYEIYPDTKGRVWLSTSNGGLRAYRYDNFEPIEALSHPDKDVRQIIETRDGELVLITDDGNVYAFRSDMGTSQHQETLRHIKGARGVVQDLNGFLWFTSANGLFRYMPNEKSLTLYEKTDGIDNPNFNPGRPIVDSDGVLYLFNTDGLVTANVRITPDSRISRSKAVPSHLEDSRGLHVYASKPNEEGTYIIDLPNKENHIKVYFSDFTYSGVSDRRYQYSLDKGKTWDAVGADMSVSINNLKSGTNVLQVRQPGNPATETEVEIHTPADASWLGWVFAVMCLGVAVWACLKLRKRRRMRSDASSAIIQDEEMPEAEGAGASEEEQAADEGDSDAKPEKKKYAANYMSDKECAQVVKRMTELLREKRLFTNPDLKIGDIARELGVSSHKLSFVLSQYLKTSYYDFIYGYRIEEFKRLVKEDKKQVFTLTALSEQAGFNSRATFFRAFKKAEGITPGDYLKRLREGE